MSLPPRQPERPLGRAATALRPVAIELGAMKFAEGSALITLGDTRVLAAASVEGRVPPFMAGQERGWVTAEYSMLPRATATRSPREVTRGRPSGRTNEIQRLIGRSLRAVVDPAALGERTITLDCDVLQADGGTRTASITAAWVALAQACARLLLTGDIARWPLTGELAAISVGLLHGQPLLDLEYVEDQAAEVDMNVVATAGGDLVEVQGTGEGATFRRAQLDELRDLALVGIATLVDLQRATLAPLMAEVEAVSSRPRGRAKAKSEREVWGRP
jgi:ribonuclease PH